MREQSAVQRREAAIPVHLLTGDILHNRKNELDLMIARRAFELFKGCGGGNGHDVDDWITAELELLPRPSSSAPTYRALSRQINSMSVLNPVV